MLDGRLRALITAGIEHRGWDLKMNANAADEKQLTAELKRLLGSIESFFEGGFNKLEFWLPDLSAAFQESVQNGQKLGGNQLASLVKERATQLLSDTEVDIYGAGYCGSEALVAAGNPLAWWQGENKTQLASSAFGPGQVEVDIRRLEWYRVPAQTGNSHIAGPFVDYLCSNEITLTLSKPLFIADVFMGVACLDVLLETVERHFLPELQKHADLALINESGRVVITSDLELETGDKHPVKASPEGAGQFRVIASETCPFLLVQRLATS